MAVGSTPTPQATTKFTPLSSAEFDAIIYSCLLFLWFRVGRSRR